MTRYNLTMTPEQAAAHQKRVGRTVEFDTKKPGRLALGAAPAVSGDTMTAKPAAEPRKSTPGKPAAPRKYRKPGEKLFLSERQVLHACMAILEAHPLVALWWRQNTGSVKIGPRYLKFSFKGASDLMGVLAGGRFLACECKATGKIPSPDQAAFLANVHTAGGMAICVDDPAYLFTALEAWRSAT